MYRTRWGCEGLQIRPDEFLQPGCGCEVGWVTAASRKVAYKQQLLTRSSDSGQQNIVQIFSRMKQKSPE